MTYAQWNKCDGIFSEEYIANYFNVNYSSINLELCLL